MVGERRSFCQCFPGTEEGSVNLVNHVVATEHRLGQLSQSRLLEPHKLTEPRALVWQEGDRAEQRMVMLKEESTGPKSGTKMIEQFFW